MERSEPGGLYFVKSSFILFLFNRASVKRQGGITEMFKGGPCESNVVMKHWTIFSTKKEKNILNRDGPQQSTILEVCWNLIIKRKS